MIRSRYKYISWLLPAAAIVLALLIAIPAHAKQDTIDVVAPGNFDFGVFAVGENTLAVAPTAGSVTITDLGKNPLGYTVTAMDENQSTDTGKMLMAGSDALTNELEIYDGTTWANASTGLTYTGVGLTGVLSFDARQTIAGTEMPGVYAIIIEFVGTITY